MYSTLSGVWEFHFVLLWCSSHWVFLSLFSIKVSINWSIFHITITCWVVAFFCFCCCCFDLVLIVCAVVAKSRLMIILHIEFVVVCLFRCSTVCNTRYNICTPTDWLTTTAQIEKFLQTDHGVEQVEMVWHGSVVCLVMAVVVFCLITAAASVVVGCEVVVAAALLSTLAL